MSGFVKLDCGILDSTLWLHDHDVLRVWIYMLAEADVNGIVRAAVPNVAERCRITLERLLAILAILEGPDQYSRSQAEAGRRLKRVQGGWIVVNYADYRDLRQGVAGSSAERMRRYRARKSAQAAAAGERVTERNALHGDVTESHGRLEGEGEGEEKTLSPSEIDVDADASTDGSRSERVPYKQIVALYHEHLPMLPAVEKLTKVRKGLIRQRCIEDLPDLDAWRRYFRYVAKSAFLTGRAPATKERPPFRANLEWLCRPSNFTKVCERFYHHDEA